MAKALNKLLSMYDLVHQFEKLMLMFAIDAFGISQSRFPAKPCRGKYSHCESLSPLAQCFPAYISYVSNVEGH